jgi:hypothetical protein
MSRSRSLRRWTAAALLTGLVGIGAAGCVAVPVGGYDGGYAYGPGVGVAAPGITVAPSFYYGRGGYYRGGYYGGRYYSRHWR